MKTASTPSLAIARGLMIGSICIAGAMLYNGARDREQQQCLAFLQSSREGMSAAWLAALAQDRPSAVNAIRNLRSVYGLQSGSKDFCVTR